MFDVNHIARVREITHNASESGERFFSWYDSVLNEPAALEKKHRALIALACSLAVQCSYCIDAYSSACIDEGWDLDEMSEALHVAAAIRAGATIMHGMQMRDRVQKRTARTQARSDPSSSP